MKAKIRRVQPPCAPRGEPLPQKKEREGGEKKMWEQLEVWHEKKKKKGEEEREDEKHGLLTPAVVFRERDRWSLVKEINKKSSRRGEIVGGAREELFSCLSRSVGCQSSIEKPQEILCMFGQVRRVVVTLPLLKFERHRSAIPLRAFWGLVGVQFNYKKG